MGINLAVQDAVAAANLLADPLLEGRATDGVLARIQHRREFPTRVTQTLQIAAHKGLDTLFHTSGPIQVPWQVRAVDLIPGRKWIMGYVVGVGVRPEHVAGAALPKPRPAWSLAKAATSAGALVGALVAIVRTFRAA